MTERINDHDLQKYRVKVAKGQQAIQGALSYENILLHRYGFTNKTHLIDPNTGEIKERVKRE